MKITNLKCEKCGGNLVMHSDNSAICKFCESVYFVEEDGPDKVINNTIINNYGTGFEYDTRIGNSMHGQNSKKYLALLRFGIVFFFIIIVIIGNMKSNVSVSSIFYDEKYVPESPSEAPLAEGDQGDYSDGDYNTVYFMDVPMRKLSEKDFQADAVVIGNIEYIEQIHKFVKMKELVIVDATEISDYSFLSNLPKLERLKIVNANHLTHIDFVVNMNKLEDLSIAGSQVSDLFALKDKLSIQNLTLIDNVKIMDYSVISSLKSLRTLLINPIREESMPNLDGLEFLEIVDFNVI